MAQRQTHTARARARARHKARATERYIDREREGKHRQVERQFEMQAFYVVELETFTCINSTGALACVNETCDGTCCTRGFALQIS